MNLTSDGFLCTMQVYTVVQLPFYWRVCRHLLYEVINEHDVHCRPCYVIARSIAARRAAPLMYRWLCYNGQRADRAAASYTSLPSLILYSRKSNAVVNRSAAAAARRRRRAKCDTVGIYDVTHKTRCSYDDIMIL